MNRRRQVELELACRHGGLNICLRQMRHIFNVKLQSWCCAVINCGAKFKGMRVQCGDKTHRDLMRWQFYDHIEPSTNRLKVLGNYEVNVKEGKGKKGEIQSGYTRVIDYGDPLDFRVASGFYCLLLAPLAGVASRTKGSSESSLPQRWGG